MRGKQIEKIKLVPIDKKPTSKVIIKGDWNDGDYITNEMDYDEYLLPSVAILKEMYSMVHELQTVNGKRWALDIRNDFGKCLKRFIGKKVKDEKLRGKLLDEGELEGLEDTLSELIPYESNSGLGSHSITIKIIKDGHECKMEHSFSIDELFEYLYEIHGWD